MAGRQLDVVGAFLGGDGEAVDRLRQVGPRQFRRLARAPAPCRWRCPPSAPAPRVRRCPRPASFSLVGAGEPEHAADAHAVERVAVLDLPAPHPHQRQLAGMRRVIGLDDLRDGIRARLDAEPRGGLGRRPASRGAAPSTGGARRNRPPPRRGTPARSGRGANPGSDACRCLPSRAARPRAVAPAACRRNRRAFRPGRCAPPAGRAARRRES